MNEMRFSSGSNSSSTDPRQVWKERNNQSVPTSSSEPELVRVAVKINDLEAWKHLRQGKVGAVISCSPTEWIVTAQVLSTELSHIRSQPWVISLEQGRSVSISKIPATSAQDEGKSIGSQSVDLMPPDHNH